MMNYMEEWRQQIEQHKYHDRNKPHVYKPRAAAEMAIISETIKKHRQKGARFNVIIEKCMADWEEGFREEREAAGAPDTEVVKGLVEELFVKIFERSPSPGGSPKV